MGTIFIVLGILGIVLLVGWQLFGAKLGLPATTTATVDKVAAFADEATFLTSLVPAYLLALKRGDVRIKDLLSQCRQQAATWDDAVVAPAIMIPLPAPVVTVAPTLADLAAKIAALEAAQQAIYVPDTSIAKA